jgi:hypothetical protein
MHRSTETYSEGLSRCYCDRFFVFFFLLSRTHPSKILRQNKSEWASKLSRRSSIDHMHLAAPRLSVIKRMHAWFLLYFGTKPNRS